MTKPLLVYVAGPYTHGDEADNVRNAWLAGHAIYEAGHLPVVPHLFHFAHFITPMPFSDWCRLDLRWLAACHVVLRLPGESPGSDREVDAAKQLGLPVYFGLEACLRDLPRAKGTAL